MSLVILTYYSTCSLRSRGRNKVAHLAIGRVGIAMTNYKAEPLIMQKWSCRACIYIYTVYVCVCAHGHVRMYTFLSKHCHRCQSLHLKTFSQKILIRSFVMQRCVSSATAHLKASGVEKLLGLLDVLTLCRFLCLRCPIRWNKHHGTCSLRCKHIRYRSLKSCF